jgi:hypothetical protein
VNGSNLLLVTAMPVHSHVFPASLSLGDDKAFLLVIGIALKFTQ